jgi:hypothetical protein
VTEIKSWTISTLNSNQFNTQNYLMLGGKLFCANQLLFAVFLPKYLPFIQFTSHVKIKFFPAGCKYKYFASTGWEMWQRSAQSIYGKIEKHYSWWNYNSKSRQREREIWHKSWVLNWERGRRRAATLYYCAYALRRESALWVKAQTRFSVFIFLFVCCAAFHHGSK